MANIFVELSNLVRSVFAIGLKLDLIAREQKKQSVEQVSQSDKLDQQSVLLNQQSVLISQLAEQSTKNTEQLGKILAMLSPPLPVTFRIDIEQGEQT